MDLDFYIVDKNGKPIIGGQVFLTTFSDGWISNPIENETGSIHVYPGVADAGDIGIIVDVPGYDKISVRYVDMYGVDQIVLTQQNSFPAWQIALVIAAVLLYKRKNKKVGKVTTADLWPIFLGVAGLIGFDLIKKILEWLGIWDSKENKALDNAESSPDSFWNPNYWITIKPASAQWTYAISEATATEWCKEIYNSMGAFNDCEECVVSVFNRCRTKANASFLAWVFNRIYGQSLLPWLRGGNWPQDRLSDADVYKINSYISQLPNY